MNSEELVKKLKSWFISAATLRTERPLCTLGYSGDFSFDSIKEYFDTTELTDKFAEQFNNKDLKTKKGYSLTQADINFVYSLHKSFVARHKTRLQLYRDDAAQKGYYCRRAVEIALHKFLLDKEQEEK